MSFSYSGNPDFSQLDYVRFKIGDTVQTVAILQDEEINYMITVATSASHLLAMAFRQVATHLGAKLVKRTLGPQSEDATARHKYFVQQAEYYEQFTAFSGTPPLPPYSADAVFDKGMMPNV